MKKLKKSVWLPVLLLIYFIAMTITFAPELIHSGQTMRLYTVGAIEVAVIIVLHFFLKKRENIG